MTAAKRAAGEAAAELVVDGMRLGLGTGSTVAFFLDALAARHLDVAGVPTSEATAARCRELGIRLLDVATTTELDLAVDGADELDRDLQLTKGGGGALLREKVVASLATRFVVIATADKLVTRLGDRFPIPIEVVPFALGPVHDGLARRGFDARQRLGTVDAPYVTDNGNYILDARLAGGIVDPVVCDLELALIPGVADHGLFVDLATEAILGTDSGELQHLHRPAETG